LPICFCILIYFCSDEVSVQADDDDKASEAPSIRENLKKNPETTPLPFQLKE
jgi:hypothetical protein